MNWTETNQFLIEEVQSRWPAWKPTDMEVKDWRRVLGCYAKDVAEEAMFNYVKDANRITRRPLIAVFITKAKLLINRTITTEETEAFKPEPGKLYGKPAREKAFTGILNGEEGSGKRWLIDFLRGNPALIPSGVTLPTTSEAKGPVDDSVGGVLRVTPALLGKPNPGWVGDNPEPPPDDDIPF